MTQDINYYRKTTPIHAQPTNMSRGYTSWLRGETADMYSVRLQAEGLTGKELQQRLYMDHRTVANESKLKFGKDLRDAYHALYRSQPAEIQKLLRPGDFANVQTMKNMPHYSYGALAEMTVTYDDGSKSVLQLAASNFPAKVLPGDNGFQFKDVPMPRDGVAVRSQYFCVARKIDPLTGKPGELDPNFTKDGIAFTPKDARELVQKVLEVGRNSIQAERAHRLKVAKEEMKAGGWSMRGPFDPRSIDKAAGIRQGNVIRPQLQPYENKPAPSVKREQENTLKRAM